jgi:hypothetical protein
MKILDNLVKKMKNFLSLISDGFWLVTALLIAAILIVFLGKLINYSPWSLLFIDLVLIFVVKKFVDERDERFDNTKTKFSWAWAVLFILILNGLTSIAVSFVYSWAILNLIVIVFLFFFSLIVFKKRARQKTTQKKTITFV